jgi:predicted Zn-ribbon and HTH transcriptional regulator
MNPHAAVLPPATCRHCRYTWTPRISNPKCCPECKSRTWNREPAGQRATSLADQGAPTL